MTAIDYNYTLIEGLQNNELTAFDALYYQYHQQVFSNIRKLIDKYEVAEDLLQEVFLALWECRASLDPQQPVAGWLFVVSYNKSINWLKKDLREANHLKQVAGLLADEGDAMQKEQLYAEQLRVLNELVEKLPQQKKRAFTLCKVEGRTYEEAGFILGVSTDTVKEYVKVSNQLIRKYLLSMNRCDTMSGVTGMFLLLCS